jgi:hypothetical protein
MNPVLHLSANSAILRATKRDWQVTYGLLCNRL